MLKKASSTLTLIFILFLFSASSLHAQKADSTKSNWSIASGFGYYNPPTTGTANMFYSEIGYQLNTGYNVGVGFGLGNVFDEYSQNSTFEGMRRYKSYYLLRLFLNRPFKFGPNQNHQLKVGGGFVYIQPRYSHPRAALQPIYDDQGNVIEYELILSQNKSTSKSIELGFPLILEYGYSLGPLTIGARFESHILYANTAFESYIISPQISLDF